MKKYGVVMTNSYDSDRDVENRINKLAEEGYTFAFVVGQKTIVMEKELVTYLTPHTPGIEVVKIRGG